jgi:drug/metabolite transporter (DMT)-like permease
VTITAVVLILISTVTHVGWNLVGKRERPTAAFFLVANTLGCSFLGLALIPYGRALTAFPAQVWALIGVTGAFQALYYAALAGAYRNGDLSVAYPLARSAPVVLVAVINLLLWPERRPSVQAILGMLLIVLGSLSIPLQRLTDWHPRRYLGFSALLALVAALGTSGYSLVDDHALRFLREAPNLTLPPLAATALFSFFEGISSSFWLALFVLTREEGRADLRTVLHTHLGRSWLAGVGIYVTYTLVLVSMAFVTNVSYVVAFRQLSIPLGALAGVMILKEPHPLPKFVGVALISVGLVLVSTG